MLCSSDQYKLSAPMSGIRGSPANVKNTTGNLYIIKVDLIVIYIVVSIKLRYEENKADHTL